MKQRSRPAPFQPDLLRGGDRATLNAEFLSHAQALGLLFQCTDCLYFRRADRACTVGWPNDALLREPFEAVAANGEPAFCKAFEPE